MDILTTKAPRHQEEEKSLHSPPKIIDWNRLDALGKEIVNAAFNIHKKMGPGLLESIYEECFCIELSKKNIFYEFQKPLHLSYDGVLLKNQFRLDLIIENTIIIELKSVESLLSLHHAQILSYLKLTDCKLGYLINFNVPLIKDGIKRIAN